MTVSVQAEPINIGDEYAALVGDAPGAAVATFTGYVRDHTGDNPVSVLHLEHYPEMAIKVLQSLGQEALARFGLLEWRIVHRFGSLSVGETIVWVGAVADHRGEAISACEFMMDTLKTDAPFWKREQSTEGTHWVASRGQDEQRRVRWKQGEGG